MINIKHLSPHKMSYIPLPTSYLKRKLLIQNHLQSSKKRLKVGKSPNKKPQSAKKREAPVPVVKINLSQYLRFDSQKTCRDDPLRMDRLRWKFIQAAKACLGIPYGKKYLTKHPEYNGIFLDCCGLVRRVVNSLSKEFGFKLGRWNQCYQYDMLPKEIPLSKMKPGDLIFYSGLYYPDHAKKQQTHNMVHVEIYLGGEKTIGSRETCGVVSIYDSFQFVSENYYNIEYHFKSIDTWLKGILKSFCKYHRWDENNSAPSFGNNYNNKLKLLCNTNGNNKMSSSFTVYNKDK